MAYLYISLLGPFRAELDGEQLRAFHSDKVRALLAYLSVEAERPWARSSLAALLWPDFLEGSALGNLRNALSNLRGVIGDRRADPPLLHISRATLQFNAAADYWLDVHRFLALVPEPGLARRTPSDLIDVERLEKVRALYRGDFMEGFAIDSAPFEQWMLATRQRMEQKLLQTVQLLTLGYELREDVTAALASTLHWLELESWSEAAHRARMRLLMRAGHRSAALAQYEACCLRLQEDLGIEPGPETTQLYKEIKRGQHRPKRSDEMPMAAVSASDPDPLPPDLTKKIDLSRGAPIFVGRQQTLETIHHLLRTRRLLTLTGPGGSGKTRLAQEVARQSLPRYRHGVFAVSLAPLDDPELVITAIAETLGVEEGTKEPLLTSLQRFLAQRELLLLLDNFEHLLAAAPPLADLLAVAQKLTLLVTSREPLRLYGEHRVPVGPLALPATQDGAPETLLQAPAIQLFVARARAVRPNLSLNPANVDAIVSICRLLDGMPLAIELAAARTRLFAPHALLARLRGDRPATLHLLAGGPRDQPERQQTLRAAIDWSYRLLLPEEQALFRGLSVFAGGATLEAVAAVCLDKPEHELASIDLLSSLVDKNLVTVADGPDGEPRFSMLYVIREYARERLERQREARGVGERHACYFLALAEEKDPAVARPDPPRWMERLDNEHDNLRVAIGWALANNRVELVLRPVLGLRNLWMVRGHAAEGCRWFQRVLAASDEAPASLRAAGIHALAVLTFHRDDDHTALELNRRALALYREAGDRRGIARTLAQDGAILRVLNQRDQAWASMEESLRVAREMEDDELSIHPLVGMGAIAHFRQEYVQSYAFFQEASEIASETGDRMIVALAVWHHGMALSEQGDHQAGLVHVERALAIVQTIRYPGLKASVEAALGFIACRLGDLGRARSCLLDALQTVVGLDLWGANLGRCCNGLAAVAEAQRQDERAVGLLAASDFFFGDFELSPYRRQEREQVLAAVRDRMAPPAFERAWAAGRRLAEDGGNRFLAFVREPVPTTTSRAPRAFDLTPRQLDVLRLVAQGLSDVEIAAELDISPRTVNNHLTAIYPKLDVHSRTAAARVAQEHELL